jgi:hypothetical protein
MFYDGGGGRKRAAAVWNSRYAGERAFNSQHPDGYFYGRLFKHHHLAHRILWAIHTCAWPEVYIDHKNGVRTDNRITNLREVDRVHNARNMGISRANNSGITGVHWMTREGQWGATIYTGGKNLYLGRFRNKRDAAKARREAEQKYGFHANHGRAYSVQRRG